MTFVSWRRAGAIAAVGAAGALALAVVATLAVREDPAVEAVAALEPVAPPTSGPASASSHAKVVTHRHEAIPILMYHVIGDPSASVRYPELFVRRRDLADQMDWLARHGYTAITLFELWEHWHGRADLPRRPIVITFDDGARGVFTRARPILASYGWPGVLNLDVSNIDPSWGFGKRRISRLVTEGWEVNSHTLTHPDLTTLDDVTLRREVAGSRAEIQRRFDVPAHFFCYPSGRFDDRVIAAVKATGYLGATTTVDGLVQRGDPYRLARVRVNRSDGVAGMARALAETIRG